MSLDNFQLPPFLTEELYRDCLVDLETAQHLKPEKFVFLGENEKNVLVMINEENTLHPHSEDLLFLTGILKACKLFINDVAIVNFKTNPSADYKSLTSFFKPHTILCLGISPAELAFPLQFPEYQVQQYNHHTYLCAPSLKLLAADKDERLRLWNCLKKIFPVS